MGSQVIKSFCDFVFTDVDCITDQSDHLSGEEHIR